MTAFMTPTTMPEWMGQVNRRLAVIERHRHGPVVGGDNSVTESSKWFRADAARVDTPINTDGNYVLVPLATADDPFGMLNSNFGFVAPRSGPVQFSAAVSVNFNGPNAANTYPILWDETDGTVVLRGTQFSSPTPTWPNGWDQVTALSGIVDVVEGHTYYLWQFVSSAGNVKSFHSWPENTFLSGAYVDGSSMPGAQGEPGPPGPAGQDGGLDSGWHYVGTTGEPALGVGIAQYSAEATGWGPARFRRDAAGCVHLDGLLNNTVGAPPFVRVFTLPAGFRPATRQLFAILANQGASAPPTQIEVLPTGEVNLVYASAAGGNFFFLSAVTFMAEDALTVAWIPVTLQNGWVDYDTVAGTPGTHGAPAYFIDSAGDVHLRGIISGGTLTAFTLPVGAHQTDFSFMMTLACAGSPSSLARLDVKPDGRVELAGYTAAGNNLWISLAGAVLPNPTGTWVGTIALTNGWTRYDNNWPPAQYTVNKYGVASLRGLVSSGTTSIPTKITMQAAPVQKGPAYQRSHLDGSQGPSGFNGAARLDITQTTSLEFVGFILGAGGGWMWVGGRWFFGD
jgi:hypothetical protein